MPDSVLVTRPEPGATETAERLAALGFRPVLAPVMTIAPRPLAAPRLPQAVLITSGNAVPALPAALYSLPLFAVGDATAARARAAGFSSAVSASGDAVALAAMTVAGLDPTAGPLLLASGAGQGTALAEALRSHGFKVQRRIAYATRPAERLPDAAQSALAAGTLRAALFFSPRSARIFMAILQRDMPPGIVRGVEALAISSRTEAALKSLPWRRIRVASHPNQDELLKLLQ